MKRATENKIYRIGQNDALPRLMNQIYRPRQTEGLLKTMDYVNKLLEQVPMYILECNMDKEAAKVAYEGMNK